FMAAKAQNIPLVSITPTTANQLDTAGYSADAKARMSDALQAGKVVIVPQTPVSLNGQPHTAWYEVDPVTGVTVDTGEDGNHQGIRGWSFGGALTAGLMGAIAAIAGVGAATPFVAKVVCTNNNDRVSCKAAVTGASALIASVLTLVLTQICLLTQLFAFR